MEPIACLISICKNEHSPILINVCNGVEHFKEYMRQEDRVGWWADPIVNLGEIVNMRLIRLAIG